MPTEHFAPGALNRSTIASLLERDPPLLAGCVNVQQQLQPNGFDLTLSSVSSYEPSSGPGRIGVLDADRVLPGTTELAFDLNNQQELEPGSYLITFNETVNLPLNLMALVRPRSSLLRSGVAIHTAVWDAGYSGRSQALLVVHHPNGFQLQRDARIAQMVFFPLVAADAEGYAGRYQNENL